MIDYILVGIVVAGLGAVTLFLAWALHEIERWDK